MLAPIAGHLGDSRLLIVTEGALQYIPFGALPDPAATADETSPYYASTPLGESHEIDRVVVWNRSDYGWTRLDGFRVQLLDENRKLIWKQTPRGPPTAKDITEFLSMLTGDLPEHALEFDGNTAHVAVPTLQYDGSHPITIEAVMMSGQNRGVAVADTQQAGVGLSTGDHSFNFHAWNGNGCG